MTTFPSVREGGWSNPLQIVSQIRLRDEPLNANTGGLLPDNFGIILSDYNDLRLRSSRRMMRAASKPSMSGMEMSIRTTSG